MKTGLNFGGCHTYHNLPFFRSILSYVQEDYKKHGNKPGPLISSHQLLNKTINKATSSSTTKYGASATNISPIDPEDTEIQKFKCLLEYYNLWTPLPDINRLRSIRIELLPKIQVLSASFREKFETLRILFVQCLLQIENVIFLHCQILIISFVCLLYV